MTHGREPRAEAARERGLVLRVDRKRVLLEVAGEPVEAQVRGRVHRGRGRSGSPVAVGDDVLVEREREGTVIVAVEPRRSALIRPEVAGSFRNQVLVANADRAVLVFAHRDPRPAAGLVDRLLVACHAGSVPPVLVFNKADLDPDPETEALLRLYERLGYDCVRSSAETGAGLEALRALLAGRRSVFAGPSGTGKSSLINRALPGVELRTGEISRHTGKGKHTTTAAQLVRIPGTGGHVIDTPGIKEFGLTGIARRELALQFPEFPVPNQCRFLDCVHVDEPGCAVRAAVTSGEVSRSRYDSYLTFLGEIEDARPEW